MPRPPNRTLRLLVPLAVILLLGGTVFYAVLRNSRPSSQTGTPPAPVQTQAPLSALTKGPASAPDPAPTPKNSSAGVPPSPPATPAQAAGTPTPENPTGAPAVTSAGATPPAYFTATPGNTAQPAPAQPAIAQPGAATPAAPVQADPAAVYAARVYDFGGYDPIGSLTPAAQGGQHEMEVRFNPYGAGIDRLALANHYTTVKRTDHEVVQEFTPLSGHPQAGLAALGALEAEVNGKYVQLAQPSDKSKTFWRQAGPGRFEATVEDRGTEVLRITRVFGVDARPGSYELTLQQTIENLSPAPVSVRWVQMGPLEQPLHLIGYGGDTRRIRFGYLPAPSTSNPGPRTPIADEFILPHQDVLGKPDAGTAGTLSARWTPKALWPTPLVKEQKLELSWAATLGRYFAVAAHPGPAAGPEPALSWVESVHRLAVPWDQSTAPGGRAPEGLSGLRLTSAPVTVAPGGKAELALGVYAGPISKPYIEADGVAARMGLAELVYYSFGGPCAFCTFQVLAQFLRAFLGALEGYVLHDWALAVMMLVVCVRTILHPVTRWAQTSLYRFSKQMGRIAPKQKAIQEKYKDDQAKMREELMRLNREEGVSYAGALGCLPMFLQTPVWIALYAMIYFTFELRHDAAFFGVVQNLTGGRWRFLADLAEPDNLVNFHDAFGWRAEGFYVWGLSYFMGPVTGINIIPLILGVVFYIQQKYLTPPPTTALTPEQEQQQKIMKVVSVVMFPLFMYNAPAALSLYFMTNSTLGILESKWIRHKAEEADKRREAEAALRPAAPRRSYMKNADPKKETFMERLQRMALEVQRAQEEQKKGKGGKR